MCEGFFSSFWWFCVLQVGAVIVYTFVFHVLAPPKDANRESSPEIDIKVESISPDHIDDANGFAQTNFLPDNIQNEDSISVPLLLPQSSDTLPKVRESQILSFGQIHLSNLVQWEA
jgi:hypothetical protein